MQPVREKALILLLRVCLLKVGCCVVVQAVVVWLQLRAMEQLLVFKLHQFSLSGNSS